jgi:hypothetical protein
MGTVISFSKWLQTRDSTLAETIQNEAGFAKYMAYPMMMAALGTSAARSAFEVPGVEHEPEVPMSAPERPGEHGGEHGGHDEKKHGPHDQNDELGHYVAETLMRRLQLMKSKVEHALSLYGMPFHGWVVMMATKFFRGVVQTVQSIPHLLDIVKQVPQKGKQFLGWIEEQAKEVAHHMGEKMRDPFGGEGPPEDAGPALLAHKSRSFLGSSRRSEAPFGPHGGYGMVPTRATPRIHRRQHRGGF